MCCRYYFADEMKRIKQLAAEVKASVDAVRPGDRRPADKALVITGRKPGLVAEDMRWGFVSSRDKSLLINARAESAAEKRTFADSVMHRRCIIPAKHFYEWDKEKNKSTFFLKEEPLLFMAGFYNCFDEEDRFIILTTEANDSMRPVHDRMPLILPEEEIGDWLLDDEMVREFLKKGSPMLDRTQEFQQMSLF